MITEFNKRRVLSCGEEDRISNLPGHLIDTILERFRTEFAARLSVLSKKWRHRWTTIRTLVFDKYFSSKFATNGYLGCNGFIRIINTVLILHKGPILKFHLHIPNISLDSFQEVDQFIALLSRNGVRELKLTNSNECYRLPSHLFSCLELTKLELQNCFFKQPLEFEGFLNLEELLLEDIDFGANLCGTKINLPRLKKLILHTCTNVYNFNIKATKLQDLTVVACPDAMLLQLLDSSCLFVAWITFKRPVTNFVRVKKINLATMLSNLPRIEYFYINSHFLKFLAAEKIPKLLPCAIGSLKHLRLLDFQLGDLDLLHGALCLLRNSPNLESFHMYMLDVQELRVDMRPAINYLESPNCLDCTLNQLQNVEIISLHGSKAELLFIKILLAHSPALEKFTIKQSGAADAQKRLDIAKYIMWFPRASPEAKIIYLNPET
ncbi:unnamed protein product [Lactuca virosa]|uniref:FBD domain-containing protein n=1 Tax=Lactuca virosa TaxID=75947 RepID=A0AAU9NTH5_9ASTR|nr:unnamed protein product [Lactuca virosa]